MTWNNGYERKKFEMAQEKLAKEYEILGMNEEAIQELYEFDLKVFNSDRKYYSHTQDFPDFDEDDEDEDAERFALYQKFMAKFSETDENSPFKSRYWWIEELDDIALYRKIISLSDEDIELLTLFAIEGFTQEEIAEKKKVIQSVISRKITRIKNYFQKH